MRSKKAIYNIISNLILQIVVVLYGFIVPKIIINNFGSDVNGLVSSITQFLAYISLLESGVGPVVKAALYKPIVTKDKKTIANILKTSEKFFKTISYVFLIYIFLLSVFFPLLINNNFGYLYTVSLIIIISISTFAEYFFGMTYRLYLQSEQKTYIISIIQIFTYLLSTILIVIMAKLEMNIQIIKLVSGIVFVLRPILQNLYVKKKYKINLELADSKYELKQKWDGLTQHIASVVHNNTDVTILTFFCKLSEVSVYSVYYLVVKGIKSIIQAFSSGIDASFGNMIAIGEHENLNRKFSIYEVAYFTICTIVFSCTIILIVPFIEVYTKGITDANYVRYLFGALIVISEYIWAVRLPYSSITLAAGHFKETRLGAWVEAISNIVISLIFVKKLGIVGVTIGTIVGMTIRTIEFIYHANKYILRRNVFINIKKIFFVIIETIIIFIIVDFIPFLENTSYLTWGINAVVTVIIALIVTVTINYFVFKKEFLTIIKIFNSFLKRKNLNTIKQNQDNKDITLLNSNLTNDISVINVKNKKNLSYEFFEENDVKDLNHIISKNDLTRDNIQSLIREDNSYIKNIDFNKIYNFDIVELLLQETKVFNFHFQNNYFLRNGRYPRILSRNYNFMRYVIDKDYNNIAYIDTNFIEEDTLKKIIDYAFRKVYYMQQEGKNEFFDLENIFQNSDIINNEYFKLCLKYLKKY